MDKTAARKKRAKKTRKIISEHNMKRLCIYRTSKHIYAQIYDETGRKVIVSASTLEKELRDNAAYTGNILAATDVGKRLATRALESGVESVAFDRSGFKYHGRVKALADAAREIGLRF